MSARMAPTGRMTSASWLSHQVTDKLERLVVPAYQIGYETSWGRCAWCWDELPRTETHTVVTALTPPFLVLHLHHACFDAYRYTSGLELAAVGSSKDWPPERLERLRITLGWDLRRFSLRPGCDRGNVSSHPQEGRLRVRAGSAGPSQATGGQA